ncbi:MAG: hypothetical protein LBC03_05805 [Nitrososphaerota archaeon]|jgi:parallel beta-helix repeat protein|nr:hypothetical protein [Nitrososphaerota archaeon]
MSIKVKSKFNLRQSYSRCALFIASLLFMVLLVSSAHFISTFNSSVSPFVTGVSYVVVNTETELKNVTNMATGSTVIALNGDIILTETYTVSNKNITLISNNNNNAKFKLIGPNVSSTIHVNGGMLTLNGIIVTHETDSVGRGIHVNTDSTLIMVDGEISGNTNNYGGGVTNSGTFTMYGGTITNNTAREINWFDYTGRHVDTWGSGGGGVFNYWTGFFTIHGGEISGNTATDEGGGVYTNIQDFTMHGGVISNNTASNGGGICINGPFNMFDGEISGNTALNNGGGMYLNNGTFIKCTCRLTAGKISGNTALNNGGGIWVDDEKRDNLFVDNRVLFENNHASTAYDRTPEHDAVYNKQISSDATWTAPFTQGYNNYDISYTKGYARFITIGEQTTINILHVIVATITIVIVGTITVLAYYFRKIKRNHVEKKV